MTSPVHFIFILKTQNWNTVFVFGFFFISQSFFKRWKGIVKDTERAHSILLKHSFVHSERYLQPSWCHSTPNSINKPTLVEPTVLLFHAVDSMVNKKLEPEWTNGCLYDTATVFLEVTTQLQFLGCFGLLTETLNLHLSFLVNSLSFSLFSLWLFVLWAL